MIKLFIFVFIKRRILMKYQKCKHCSSLSSDTIKIIPTYYNNFGNPTKLFLYQCLLNFLIGKSFFSCYYSNWLNYLNLIFIILFLNTIQNIIYGKQLRKRDDGRTHGIFFRPFSRAGNNSIHFYVAIVADANVVGWQMF